MGILIIPFTAIMYVDVEEFYTLKEEAIMYSEITKQAENIANEIIEKAKLKKGQILVVGCSSSEVCGDQIGSNSNLEVAKALFKGLYSVLEEKGIYLAAQCCEHLNRAIVVEREAVPFAEIVNVVPQPKAGGSFGTTAYKTFKNPVVVEEIKADAGIDIGGTLIGMHLKNPHRNLIRNIWSGSWEGSGEESYRPVI